MSRYVHQLQDWPQFHWDDQALLGTLGLLRHLQGRLVGRMEALGFDLRNEANLQTLSMDVLKSSEIEGEVLNPEQVRSSLARRLGMDIAGLVPSARHVEGVVEMMLDATQRCDVPLTTDRLFGWHSLMFPGGRSGLYQILVGRWRDDSTGPMQVVSGAMGRERIHFQAPPAERVEAEMQIFLDWFNGDQGLDPVIKAGVAHFWFLTIHPFEDGNGRIARALTDLLLARADGTLLRYYSLSAQIMEERKDYYEILEKSQKASLDITAWLLWFLECLIDACSAAQTTLASVLYRHRFWMLHVMNPFNDRQWFMLRKLTDGFEGKLNTSKWAKMAKCSQDTALRDINELIEKNVLRKEAAGGRSTNYELVQ
ncbi:MAG: Fic family protein [Bacteroidia bacterium]|nr:Fic family protein [Bacteroidia bacterium]